MPLQSKSKIVTFRLTDEEFQQFKTVCDANGMRSVSEVARFAIESVIHGDIALPEAQLRAQLRQLDDKVAVLDRKVEDIVQRLGK
ncbi:MAG: hypothetical protein Q8N47_25075 [Bryobacterales bacterium]|nr:hypothetical protein [Bryobacterales bacterium]